MSGGELFDLAGNVLVVVSLEESFKIGKLAFTATLSPDGTLALSRVTITENRDERHQMVLDALTNELEQRRRDLAAVDKDLQALMVRGQEGGEDAEAVGLEIAKWLAVKGKHKKRIEELEAMETVSVKYEERRKGRSAVLRAGVFVKLSFFPKPVMWCAPALEDDLEEVVPKEEKLPLSITSAAHTTATGAGLEHANPNQEVKFVITAKDSKGRARNAGGDKFVVASTEMELKATVEDNNNGTYNVSYVAAAEAKERTFPLSVSLRGHHIRGSPFAVSLPFFSVGFSQNVSVSGKVITTAPKAGFSSTRRWQ
eukprot:g5896.t1